MISTGGSSLKAVDALRDAGCEVKGMVAIFTYGFKTAEDNFAKQNVRLTTLTDYNSMIETALDSEYISEEDVESLKEWRLAPDVWGK